MFKNEKANDTMLNDKGGLLMLMHRYEFEKNVEK